MAARLTLGAAMAATCLALVTACGSSTATPQAGSASPDGAPAATHSPRTQPVVSDPVEAVKPKPLRAGESRMALRIPSPYTPKAPNGVGTDEYTAIAAGGIPRFFGGGPLTVGLLYAAPGAGAWPSRPCRASSWRARQVPDRRTKNSWRAPVRCSRSRRAAARTTRTSRFRLP